MPDLPLRKVEARTIGRTFTAPDGKVFRPSIFLTVTCRSYGRVDKSGVPYDMDAYDYQNAARDSIHYPSASLRSSFCRRFRDISSRICWLQWIYMAPASAA